MKMIFIIASILLLYACGHKFFVRNDRLVLVQDGCIFLISDKYYFVKDKFVDDMDVLKFISKPDRILYNIPFRISCQFKESLDPSSFKTFNLHILPQGSSMVGREIKYMNAIIKMVQIDQPQTYPHGEIRLQDYSDLNKEYVLKYAVQDKTLLLVIPDNKD